MLLNNASLKHVNLSGTNLQGAQLIRANLDGANMAGVQLDKPPGQNTNAAFLSQAFLRNVNLSQAKMSAADFTNANFFGSVAVGGNTCQPGSNGFTSGCATASITCGHLTKHSRHPVRFFRLDLPAG